MPTFIMEFLHNRVAESHVSFQHRYLQSASCNLGLFPGTPKPKIKILNFPPPSLALMLLEDDIDMEKRR